MNKLIAILLLSTVACFGGNKFVRGKFVNGAMPFPRPPSNGLLNNLVAYWNFNSFNGTPSSGPATIYDYGAGSFIGSGLIGGGLDMPDWGTVDLFKTTTANIPFLLSYDYTVSVWFAPYENRSASHYGTVFQIESQYGEDVAIALDEDNGEAKYGTLSQNNGVSGSSIAIPWFANQWNHFVLVFDYNFFELSIYLNGDFVDVIGIGGFADYGTVADVNVLGDSYAGVYGFGSAYGKSDEIGIWQRKLTQAQITKLYNSGAGYPFSSFNN
jgi:hypothetical protein